MTSEHGKKFLEVRVVDVFTTQAFTGNPLAVVLDARDLTSEEMQRIAAEMNLSETTFVSPPTKPKATYKMRIFTPAKEIPFAGHPSVGTAFVLAEEQRFNLKEPVTTIHQEVGIGVLPIDLYVQNKAVQKIMMTQGKPRFRLIIEDINAVARSLRVPPEEITKTGLSPQIVSTGLNQLMVPIKTLKTLAHLQPDFPLIKRLEESFGFSGCYVFTFETISPEASAHVRFFAPSVGVWEDPATGSAAGGLGSYLLRWKALPINERPFTFIIEQGHEIKRPSKIHVEVQHRNKKPTKVRVGGQAVTVLKGIIIC